MIGPIIVAVETDADGYDVELCNQYWQPQQRDIQTKIAQLQHEVDQGIYAFKWSGMNKRKFVAQALKKGHSITFRIFDVVARPEQEAK
jgi:hypothetical protein